MYYVYILLSKKDLQFYFGFTRDIERRLLEHHEGLVVSTKNRRPLILLGYECYKNRKDAMSRERYFKSGGRAKSDLKIRFRESINEITKETF